MKDKILWIILGVHIIFCIFLFDPKQDTGGDNAIYLSLAKSLISFKGYRDIYKPDEPLHTLYPPGYPLLLSIPLLFTNMKNAVPFKILNVIFSTLSLILFYMLFKNRLKGLLFYSLLFLIALNPTYIQYSHKILSEIPFMFFSFLTLYLWDIYLRKGNTKILIIISVLSIFPYYLRTAGITFIIALFLFLLLNRKYKHLFIYSIIVIILILPWIIRGSKIGSDGGYKTQLLSKNAYDLSLGTITFKDLFIRIGQNLSIYIFEIIPRFFLPFLINIKFNIVFTIIGIIFVLMSLLGLILGFNRKNLLLIIYFILFFALCLIWPSVWSSDRFLLPVLPLIFFFFYLFIDLLNRFFKIRKNLFNYVITSLFILSEIFFLLPSSFKNLGLLFGYIQGNKYSGYTLDYVRFYEAAEFARKNTPKNSKFLVRKPELFYLVSERKSFCYPFVNDENKIMESINKSDYIVVDAFYWTGTTKRYLLPVIMKNPEKYLIFYKSLTPETYILIYDKD